MFEKEILYRLCWVKNGKAECLKSCFTIKRADDILFEKRKIDNSIKNMVITCNSYLPEFMDKIRSEYESQKNYENFMGNKF